MVEYLRKFENRGTKISRGNFIRTTKSSNLLLFTKFCTVWGQLLSKAIFGAQVIHFVEKSMDQDIL